MKYTLKHLSEYFSEHLAICDIKDNIPVKEIIHNIDAKNHLISWKDYTYFYFWNGNTDLKRFNSKILAEQELYQIEKENKIDIDRNHLEHWINGYKSTGNKNLDNKIKIWSTIYEECANGTDFSFIEYDNSMKDIIDEINSINI